MWAKAEPQLLKFLRQRDGSRLRVGLYPTVTGRTVSEALNIVRWAHEHGVDDVSFHKYSPIQNSFEVEPSPSEMQHMCGELSEWAGSNEHVNDDRR